MRPATVLDTFHYVKESNLCQKIKKSRETGRV